jgi:GAF domain-containing protein
VASSRDVSETLRLIVRRFGEALGASGAAYEYAGDGDQYAGGRQSRFFSSLNLGTDEIADACDRPSRRVSLVDREVAEAHVDDPALDPLDRGDLERLSVRSRLTAPLVFGDEVVGLLDLIEKRAARRFCEDERVIAATFAALRPSLSTRRGRGASRRTSSASCRRS